MYLQSGAQATPTCSSQHKMAKTVQKVKICIRKGGEAEEPSSPRRRVEKPDGGEDAGGWREAALRASEEEHPLEGGAGGPEMEMEAEKKPHLNRFSMM